MWHQDKFLFDWFWEIVKYCFTTPMQQNPVLSIRLKDVISKNPTWVKLNTYSEKHVSHIFNQFQPRNQKPGIKALTLHQCLMCGIWCLFTYFLRTRFISHTYQQGIKVKFMKVFIYLCIYLYSHIDIAGYISYAIEC